MNQSFNHRALGPRQGLNPALDRDVNPLFRLCAWERAIQHQEARYRMLIEGLNDAFFYIDPGFRITGVNSKAAQLTGIPVEQLLGQSLLDPEGKSPLLKDIGRQLFTAYQKGQADFHYRAQTAEQWFEVSACPNLDGFCLLVSDVTGRKLRELAQVQSELRYQRLVESIGGIVWEANGLTLQFTFVSPQVEPILGYSLKQWLEPDFWVNHLYPADRNALLQASREAIARREDHAFEYRMVAADGRPVWLREITTVLTDATGQPLLRGILIDITEQKQTEARLRQQTQREHALNCVIQAIRSSLDLDTVFSTAVSEIGALLKTDLAAIAQYDSELQVWKTLAVYPGGGGLTPGVGFEVSDQASYGLSSQLQQFDILQANEVSAFRPLFGQAFVEQHSGPWLFLPLKTDTGLWGVLMLIMGQGKTPWAPCTVNLASTVAAQLAIAIQQSELYHRIQHLNASLEEQVKRRTVELERAFEFEALVKRITDRVRDNLDEQQILRVVVQELVKIPGIEGCDTSAYDLEANALMLTDGAGDLPNHQFGVLQSLEYYCDVLPQLLAGENLQFCDRVPRSPHLMWRPVAILACAIRDDQGVIGDLWLFKVAQDVFEDHEIRLAQQIANQCAIAIRQSRLYKAARSQVQDLETLNQLKDDFLSTVSHELRSPVTNMKMAIQMMRTVLQSHGEHQPLSPSRLQHYLQILEQECDREISLISDLLDLQRLDVGARACEIEPIDMEDLLTSLLESFRERAEARNQILKLDLQPLPLFQSDAGALRRILAELLHNACKYTPPAEQIVLSACATAGYVSIGVTNHGADIPLEEQSRIFEKFYRIPKGDRWQQGGTGLGLALVKGLTEHLGGQIRLLSGGGKTCFIIDLPQGGLDLS